MMIWLTVPAAAGQEIHRPGAKTTDSPSLAVCVSILPLAFFVESIGGNLVTVDVVVPPGVSPTSFDPAPQQMARLADAQLFVGVGVPMERQLLPHVKRNLPSTAIVAAQTGIPLRDSVTAGALVTETYSPDRSSASEHGTGDHEHHGEYDPHVWLSPRLAVTIARNVCAGLTRNDPTNADTYQHNLEHLEAELTALDREISQILAPVAGRDLIVFHPAYGYFAADYDLRQVAIEQGGLAPSPRHLAEVLNLVKERGETVIFLQPQFSHAAAQAVAEAAGVSLVILDPLRRDYLVNLHEMAQTIHRTLATE